MPALVVIELLIINKHKQCTSLYSWSQVSGRARTQAIMTYFLILLGLTALGKFTDCYTSLK